MAGFLTAPVLRTQPQQILGGQFANGYGSKLACFIVGGVDLVTTKKLAHVNGTVTRIADVSGMAMKFDGASSFNLGRAVFNYVPKGTVSVKFRMDTWAVTNLFYEPHTGTNNNFDIIPPGSATSSLKCNIGNNTFWSSAKVAWNLNQWYTVTISWSGTEIRIYIDGALDVAFTATNVCTDGATSSFGSYWYGTTNKGQYLVGSAAYASVFYRVLQPAEVKLYYENPWAVFKQGSLSRLPFDFTTPNVTRSLSGVVLPATAQQLSTTLEGGLLGNYATLDAQSINAASGTTLTTLASVVSQSKLLASLRGCLAGASTGTLAASFLGALEGQSTATAIGLIQVLRYVPVLGASVAGVQSTPNPSSVTAVSGIPTSLLQSAVQLVIAHVLASQSVASLSSIGLAPFNTSQISIEPLSLVSARLKLDTASIEWVVYKPTPNSIILDGAVSDTSLIEWVVYGYKPNRIIVEGRSNNLLVEVKNNTLVIIQE